MNVKKNSASAMTLLELLIGVVIIVVLAAASGLQIRNLVQKAKVQAAKTTLTGIGLCLSMIKDDACIYPEKLKDIHSADPPETHGSAKFSSRDWYGPYGETLSLIDPWGNEYHYEITETPVFGPSEFERESGGPFEETFTFPATAGKGTLIIQNPGVTSGSITLNGDEIVSPDEFKKVTPSIVKEIDLLASNSITIKLASKPGIKIKITISVSVTTKDTEFILWTYGKDGVEGGTGYDASIAYGEL